MKVPSALNISSRKPSGSRVAERPVYSTEQRATIRRTARHRTRRAGCLSAIAAACALMLAAPASARAVDVAGPLITVEFNLAPDPNIVQVHTDNHPGRWRHWPVETLLPISREDRCRHRFDARRVLLGQHGTQGVPRKCESRRARTLRPDPHPSARGG